MLDAGLKAFPEKPSFLAIMPDLVRISHKLLLRTSVFQLWITMVVAAEAACYDVHE